MVKYRIFLKIIFVSIAIATLTSCFNKTNNKETDDGIYDTETKYLNLDDAVGMYYFVPSIDDKVYSNYKTFELSNGDSIKLEIRPDSTFIFNHFYFDKMNRIDNYRGKTIDNLLEKAKIFIPFPINTTNLEDFLTSNRDTLFFYRLNMEHYSNYEYRLFLKKVK